LHFVWTIILDRFFSPTDSSSNTALPGIPFYDFFRQVVDGNSSSSICLLTLILFQRLFSLTTLPLPVNIVVSKSFRKLFQEYQKTNWPSCLLLTSCDVGSTISLSMIGTYIRCLFSWWVFDVLSAFFFDSNTYPGKGDAETSRAKN
jgi:ABC-type sulfate transport system permease subunit